VASPTSSGWSISLRKPIKVLSDGDLAHPLTVKAHRFSAAARAKIEAAGGTAEEVARAAKAN
jgi:large subunit ribosomal protein L15